jgi:hypothetical protein
MIGRAVAIGLRDVSVRPDGKKLLVARKQHATTSQHHATNRPAAMKPVRARIAQRVHPAVNASSHLASDETSRAAHRGTTRPAAVEIAKIPRDASAKNPRADSVTNSIAKIHCATNHCGTRQRRFPRIWHLNSNPSPRPAWE